MAYPSYTPLADNSDYPKAADLNPLYLDVVSIARGVPIGAHVNREEISATKTLVDGDFTVQSLDLDIDRQVTLPANASTNHPFYFWNRSAFVLTVKDASANTIIVIQATSGGFVFPDAQGWAGVSSAPKDGWTLITDTWTYASATTITVPSGAESIYSVGDKLMMTNSGTKNNYVIDIADELLTVTGDGVANAAITAPKYSKVSSPLGFPQWFAFASDQTGFSGTPTLTFRYNINQKVMTIYVNISGTSDANTIILTLPFAIIRTHYFGGFRAKDNGSIVTSVVAGIFGTTNIEFFKDWVATAWTTSGAKEVSATVSVEL